MTVLICVYTWEHSNDKKQYDTKTEVRTKCSDLFMFPRGHGSFHCNVYFRYSFKWI